MTTLKTLDDVSLLTAYRTALNLNLPSDFLGILKSEILARGLIAN